MKGKKIICGLLSGVFMIGASLAAIPGSALTTTADKDAPENRAWLADLYIRESTSDFVLNDVVPNSDLYSRTLEEFRKETQLLESAFVLDLDTLEGAYIKVIEELFQILDETNLGLSYEEMKAYLQTEWKIIFPETEDTNTMAYAAIAYACLKYDLLYPFVGVHFTVPENTTLERTVVLILTTVLGESIGDDIQTMRDYVIRNIKQSLIDAGYQITPDTDTEELIILYKIMLAEKQGYVIQNKNVAEYTDTDKQYVDNAYAASIIKMRYDVMPSVEEVAAARHSSDPDAIPRMILIAMLHEQGEVVKPSESIGSLFNRACEYGYFDLDTELYADIFDYDVYLDYNCSEIWLTPFAYAAELGREHLEFVDITINGTPVDSGQTLRFALNGDLTTAVVSLTYDNGEIHDETSYTFRIHNGTGDFPSIDLPNPPSDNNGGNSNSSGTQGGNSGSSVDLGDPGLVDLPDIPLNLYDTESKLPLTGTAISNSGFQLAGDGSGEADASGNQSAPSTADERNILVPIIFSVSAAAVVAVIIAGTVIYYKKNGKIIKIRRHK